MTCAKCGAKMQVLFTSSFCSANCDLERRMYRTEVEMELGPLPFRKKTSGLVAIELVLEGGTDSEDPQAGWDIFLDGDFLGFISWANLKLHSGASDADREGFIQPEWGRTFLTYVESTGLTLAMTAVHGSWYLGK